MTDSNMNLPAWSCTTASSEMKQRFMDDVITPANLKRMFWVVAIFLPLSVLYLVNNILYTGESILILWGSTDVACSLTFLILCWQCLRRESLKRMGRYVIVSYYAYCLASTLIYYFVSYNTAGENSIYAIGVVLPSVLFHIPTRQAIAMLLGGQIVYTLGLSLTNRPFQELLGAWITAAYGICIACLAAYFLFSREWRNFQQLQIIQQNNAELLKLNAKLEQQREEMNHVMALTAHDLRSPVLNMKGLFDVLIKKAEWQKPPYDQVLKLCRESTSSLVRLLKSLLDSYRAEQGLYDQRREPVDLMTILDQACEKYTSPEHPVTLESSVDTAISISDPIAIEQIVDNLLSNAVKFSPEGSSIQVSLSLEGTMWLLEITDQGPGIPEDERHKLFNKFFHASTNHHAQQGAGLGLFIVSQLIESLEGRVSYVAIKPHGSTFRVHLKSILEESRMMR